MKTLKIQLYRLLGFVSLSLGVLGVFLPLLPTTCFVLLAAWSFSQSSPRIYKALAEHKLFGSIIRDWQTHRAMSVKAKRVASISIIFSFSLTLFLVDLPLFVAAILLAIMLVLLASIAWIDTKAIDAGNGHSAGIPISH